MYTVCAIAPVSHMSCLGKSMELGGMADTFRSLSLRACELKCSDDVDPDTVSQRHGVLPYPFCQGHPPHL